MNSHHEFALPPKIILADMHAQKEKTVIVATEELNMIASLQTCKQTCKQTNDDRCTDVWQDRTTFFQLTCRRSDSLRCPSGIKLAQITQSHFGLDILATHMQRNGLPANSHSGIKFSRNKKTRAAGSGIVHNMHACRPWQREQKNKSLRLSL